MLIYWLGWRLAGPALGADRWALRTGESDRVWWTRYLDDDLGRVVDGVGDDREDCLAPDDRELTRTLDLNVPWISDIARCESEQGQ